MDRKRLEGIDERDESPRRRIQNADREPEAAVADRAAELTGGAILHLQRAAGNGAVSQLLAPGLPLQRQPADAPAPTQEKEPSSGGSPSPTISPFHFGPAWGPHEAKAPEAGSAEKAGVKETPHTSPAVLTVHHLFDSQVAGNLLTAYIFLRAKGPKLDQAYNYLREAYQSLDQLRQPHTDPAVRAEMAAVGDLIVEAERLVSEHAAKQLQHVETIQKWLDPDQEPLGHRLAVLRLAIFDASDPVGTMMSGQGDTIAALLNVFDHSVVDNLRTAHKALDPPDPDFQEAIGPVKQAASTLGTLERDHKHDAALLARVQLVKDLVDSSKDLIHEHLSNVTIPIDDIATMINPYDGEMARRLKVARAALG